MTPGREAPTVVYIGGAGRSGSTLLDNLLGSSPGWFSAGELRLLWSARLLWTHRCGCGRTVRDCELWSAVLNPLGDVNVSWAAGMDQRLLRSRHAWRLLRHDRVLDVPGGREFGVLSERLVRALGAATRDDVVVDSSKSPVGVAVLSAAGVNVVAVHLVRDPRAVAWSWRRSSAAADETTPFERRTVAAAATEWLTNNLAMEAACRRARVPRVRVRYEDLIDDPATTLTAIGERVGTELTLPVDGSTAHLAPNHTVAGNPSRFRTGEIRLQRDDEWRQRLSPSDRLVTTAVTMPSAVSVRLLGSWELTWPSSAGAMATCS